MSLHLIATPIGNTKDISLRALDALNAHNFIIGEEPKACRKILVDLNISPRDKTLFFLNEHSDKQQLNELLNICKENEVCLISDCGTPAFCDPGADLVRLCHQNKIQTITYPGPSTLMTFISMIGERWDSFIFLGFPPRDKNDREDFFKNLKNQKHPIFFLEAPYRLQSTLELINQHYPDKKFHLGSNLTTDIEEYFYNTPKYILKNIKNIKAPFIIGFNPIS